MRMLLPTGFRRFTLESCLQQGWLSSYCMRLYYRQGSEDSPWKSVHGFVPKADGIAAVIACLTAELIFCPAAWLLQMVFRFASTACKQRMYEPAVHMNAITLMHLLQGALQTQGEQGHCCSQYVVGVFCYRICNGNCCAYDFAARCNIFTSFDSWVIGSKVIWCCIS